MPKTKEAISHAQAAGVPIRICDKYKLDKPNANVLKRSKDGFGTNEPIS